MKAFEGPIKVGISEIEIQGQKVEGTVYNADFLDGFIDVRIPFGKERTEKELLDIKKVTPIDVKKLFKEEFGEEIDIKIDENEVTIEIGSFVMVRYDRKFSELNGALLLHDYNISIDLLQAITNLLSQY
jgi:hypothetical protein